MTVRKFLGREGRTTIPYPIRVRLGWEEGDIITFTEQEDGSVLLRQEFLCDGCEGIPTERVMNEPEQAEEEEITLQDALDGLTEQEQREALVYLTMKWAAQQAGASRR